MIILERFSVSKKLEEIGYTNKAFVYQISDRLIQIINESTSLKPYQSILTYDKIPKIEIQQGGITFKSFVQSIENYYAKKRKFVSGEITTEKHGQVTLTIRVAGHEAKRLTDILENIDCLIYKAALYILKHTEPYILAAYYQMNKDFYNALDLIHYCILNGPPSCEQWAYNLWGIYYLEKNEPQKASKKFEKATQLDENFGIAYLNWGMVLEKIDNTLESSIIKYSNAALLLPKYAPIFHIWGIALLKQGKADEALKKFKKALSLNPKNGDILKDLGKCLIQKSQFKEAITKLELAAELTPKDPEIHFLYGFAKQKMGFREDAKDRYIEAINIDPNYQNAIKHLQFLRDDKF